MLENHLAPSARIDRERPDVRAGALPVRRHEEARGFITVSEGEEATKRDPCRHYAAHTVDDRGRLELAELHEELLLTLPVG
ncbi:MAG: hypothetical protein ACRDRD_20970 [Pseudonocardiaceae bacterium]